MPKNTKRYKNRKNKNREKSVKALTLKEDEGQEYAEIIKSLGNRRFECLCFDGESRIGVLRGSMKKNKSNWVTVGDIVLVGLRSFQDNKIDILMKYTSDEVRKLRKIGEIPESTTNDSDNDNEYDEVVVFEDEVEFIEEADINFNQI